MRRASAVLVVLALGTTLPLTAQSDSSSTNNVGSTRTAAPVFHAGQWAAQFAVNNGFYGVGALRHRSANSAWALNGSFVVTHNTSDPRNYRGNFNSSFVSVGRRVYRAGTGRVRPFREVGISGGYLWGSSTSGGGYKVKSQSYNGGIYARLGAMVFLAPELGLGATFGADATYSHDHYEYTSTPLPYSNSDDSVSLSVGRVNLVGAFYF